jgi:hypothetical protein
MGHMRKFEIELDFVGLAFDTIPLAIFGIWCVLVHPVSRYTWSSRALDVWDVDAIRERFSICQIVFVGRKSFAKLC